MTPLKQQAENLHLAWAILRVAVVQAQSGSLPIDNALIFNVYDAYGGCGSYLDRVMAQKNSATLYGLYDPAKYGQPVYSRDRCAALLEAVPMLREETFRRVKASREDWEKFLNTRK